MTHKEKCVCVRRCVAGSFSPLLLYVACTELDAVVNRMAVKCVHCRLLVNLTQPTYLCFGSEYPLLQGKEKRDSETVRSFMEVDHYLRDYKDVSCSVWGCCVRTSLCGNVL